MVQRNSIQLCVWKNEIKYAKTFEMLTVAFSESSMSRTQDQLWYNRFKEGLEYVNDDARPDSSSALTIDENIEAVKIRTLDDRRITISEAAEDVGI